jgi:hypothetical protein
MNGDLRIKLENYSIELLEQVHPLKESTINVVTVGPAGLYQEIVYLAKLAKAGCKQIRLIAIDTQDIVIGPLEDACAELFPATITICKQYKSLDSYIQEAVRDETLHPDLLLLIDLTDDKYKVNSQLLSDYSFDQLQDSGLFKNGTVISYTTFEKERNEDTSRDVLISKVFSGIYKRKVEDLSHVSPTCVGHTIFA